MDRSLFGKLPPELRNTIYDLASETPGGAFIELCREDATNTLQWRIKPHTCHSNPLALTQVSKEIREEALGAFFAVNNISLIVPMLRTTPSPPTPRPKPITGKIKQWLRNLHPKERAALQTIELDLGTWVPGSQRRFVSEQYLAATLLDLAICFDNHDIVAKVWITLFEKYAHRDYDQFPASFRLSATDVEALRTLMSTAMQQQISWNQRTGQPRTPYGCNMYYLGHYCDRIQRLATELEDLIELKAVEESLGGRKRKRRARE